MNRDRIRLFSSLMLAVGLLALAFPAGADMATEGTVKARYSVVFVPSWNPSSHPVDYPFTHAKKGLLTPIIGATHGSDYRIFEKGTRPSPGLERLSEMGKHDPLDEEIRAAIRAGKAGSLIEFMDGSPGPVHVPVSDTFEIDSRFPFVSLVGMIAPSPDWFYGVSNVRLVRNDRFVSSLSVDVYAWDSGGDGGRAYMSEDMDLDPKEPTRLNAADPFRDDHGRVGVLVFTQIPAETE